MNTQYIRRILQRPGCLGAVILSAFITGGVIALLGYSLLVTTFPSPEFTPTPAYCQIELTVIHELYDTREDYWNEALPIGELEPDIYGVIGSSGDLIAIDWRGDNTDHPPRLEEIDWIHPKQGVNRVFGDCLRIQRFAPIESSMTSVP